MKIGIGPLKRAAFRKTIPQKTIKAPETLDDEEIRTAELITREMNPEKSAKTPEGRLSVDVCQTEKDIRIIAPIAGVDAKDIEITVTDDVILISGKREHELNTEENDYLTRECFWGNFSRKIILPEIVDTSRVKANFKKGILTIAIPRADQSRTRTIKIAS